MPVPRFTSDIVPEPFWMEPAKVESDAEEPVSVTAPAVKLVMIAPEEPLNVATATLNPFRSSKPPLTARFPVPRAFALPITMLPPVIVAPPL